jgi:hypothetical protein
MPQKERVKQLCLLGFNQEALKLTKQLQMKETAEVLVNLQALLASVDGYFDSLAQVK